MSCFLIFNHYCVLVYKQIVIFFSIIFKKHSHMLHIICFLFFYLILFYHSYDCFLSFSAEFHCSWNSETSKSQNFNWHNFNVSHSITHSNHIIKTTSTLNSAESITLFSILNWFIHMSFESEWFLMFSKIISTLNFHLTQIIIKSFQVNMICTLQIDDDMILKKMNENDIKLIHSDIYFNLIACCYFLFIKLINWFLFFWFFSSLL